MMIDAMQTDYPNSQPLRALRRFCPRVCIATEEAAFRRVIMPNRIDMSGQRFGRLVVVKHIGRDSSGAIWLLNCDCGRSHRASRKSLVTGMTRSCGCLARERASQVHTTHGGSSSLLYKSWSAMIQRCHNPKNIAYGYYGGRGISVCQRWRDSYAAFVSDVGERPDGTTLDRIDNDGDYEPVNVRWSSHRVQQNNMRSNIKLTLDGRTLTIAQWSRELGINAETIRWRYHRGKSVQEILKR